VRDLYPGYDVLSKRNTPSWNEITRRVIDRRLALDPSAHRFFSDAEWLTLCALCDRIVPQASDRAQIPVAAMVDLLDRPLCDGVAALSTGMVQIAQSAGLRRRLAARLARDVGLLRGGRAGAQDCRAGQLSLGSKAAAVSLPCSRAQRPGCAAGARRGSPRDCLESDPHRDAVCAARRVAAVRLSRLLHARVLDQCKAKARF
jgi:hypothetical protein